MRRRLIALCTIAALGVAGSAAPAAAARPTCAGKPATIVGTRGPDVLIGTARADVIYAGSGHDRIEARDGNDTICAGPGNDKVYGQNGGDVVYGGYGHDGLIGDGSQWGADKLFGGPGNDRLVGGRLIDHLDGGYGDDRLLGGSDIDVFRDSGGGNDYFDAGPYPDGAYDSWFPPTAEGIYVNLTTGEARTAHGIETLVGFYEITGTRHDDVLIGHEYYNELSGGGGDDHIEGRGGFDRLNGWLPYAGLAPANGDTDVLYGGAGPDILALLDGRASGGPGEDRIYGMGFEGGGHEEGATMDLAAGSSDIGTHHVRLSGIENATGTVGDDTILGNAGPNDLDGSFGDDVLDGRDGIDELSGDQGTDTCYSDPEDRYAACEISGE